MNDKLEALKEILNTTHNLLGAAQRRAVIAKGEVEHTIDELEVLTKATENLISSYDKPKFILQDFLNGEIAVRCKTRQESYRFLTYIKDCGVLWPNGASPLSCSFVEVILRTGALYACSNGYLRCVFSMDRPYTVIDENIMVYPLAKENISMKIKNDVDVHTDDFWYDLTLGGYLRPEEMLEEQSDIERVKNAIAVLQEFEKACEEQIEDFYI